MFALDKFCELFGMNAVEKIATSPQGRKVERQIRCIGRSYNNAKSLYHNPLKTHCMKMTKETLVSLLPLMNQVNEKTY